MEKVKVRFNQAHVDEVAALMKQLSLNTVCQEANCPNMGDCYKRKTATFMIMGNQCTRNCRFCNVCSGNPADLDPQEPEKIARAVQSLNLNHVVITSVTRDDLADGGANHFAACIRAVKNAVPETTIEVLIPDLKGDRNALDVIIREKPEVVNHNLETVVCLYDQVRPEANYQRSLEVLQYVKQKAPGILIKTGIMVGLGETEEQVYQVMDDAIAVGCDLFTIGQYLPPSEKHLPMKERVAPKQFMEYRQAGSEKGFRYIASGPLVRSSYHAEEALL